MFRREETIKHDDATFLSLDWSHPHPHLVGFVLCTEERAAPLSTSSPRFSFVDEEFPLLMRMAVNTLTVILIVALIFYPHRRPFPHLLTSALCFAAGVHEGRPIGNQLLRRGRPRGGEPCLSVMNMFSDLWRTPNSFTSYNFCDRSSCGQYAGLRFYSAQVPGTPSIFYRSAHTLKANEFSRILFERVVGAALAALFSKMDRA